MRKGLEEAIKIIDEEIEVAKGINPFMALGMEQIKKLIENKLKLEWLQDR